MILNHSSHKTAGSGRRSREKKKRIKGGMEEKQDGKEENKKYRRHKERGRAM